jgi:hypothetical protein
MLYTLRLLSLKTLTRFAYDRGEWKTMGYIIFSHHGDAGYRDTRPFNFRKIVLSIKYVQKRNGNCITVTNGKYLHS